MGVYARLTGNTWFPFGIPSKRGIWWRGHRYQVFLGVTPPKNTCEPILALW
jgi:hypothetical protein